MYGLFSLYCVIHVVSLSLFLSSSSFTRARQAKDPTRGSAEVMIQSTVQPLHVSETSSTAAWTPGPMDDCRVQVRLLNGKVIRYNNSCTVTFLAQPQ